MPRWFPGVLDRIHRLAAERRVLITLKALRELAGLGIGLDEEDLRGILVKLQPDDFSQRLRSMVTGEWMYVFKPIVARMLVYLKVVLRADCIVISFHEEEHDHDVDEE